MNRLPLLLLASLGLAACGSRGDDAPGVVSRVADQAVAEVRHELAVENIRVGRGKSGQPRAELAPNGDLLIDGKALPLTPEQRKLTLAYRGHVVAIAEAGTEIGLQGAELASKAVAEAARGVFNGESDKVEDRIRKETDEIKASARQLCDRLPAMLAAERQLVAAVPEFAPYADMDESDIAECRDNH